MAGVILVDSSVWIDFFNGTRNAPEAWLRNALDDGESDIIVGDLITQEVLQGFRHDAHFKQAERSLAVFPCVTLGGRDNCIAAASMYRHLRKIGVTVRKPVDVLIAAFCINAKVSLLHHDRDFNPLAAHFGLAEVIS